MENFVTKSNEAKREISVETPRVLSLTGQALIDALGPETVQAYLIDKIKIATRQKIRVMLEKTGKDYLSDEQIKASQDWSEFVPKHQNRTGDMEKKKENAKKVLQGMSPEQLKAFMASLGM